MEKTFDVVGVPKATLIFRGVALMPRKLVHLTMNEKELASFAKYLDALEYKETIADKQEEIIVVTETPATQKSEAIVEEKPQEEIVVVDGPKKEEKQNDKPSGRSNKGKSKKQV